MNTISVKNLTKKYLSSIALLLIIVLTLSGCYPTGEKPLPPDISKGSGGVSGAQGDVEASQPFVGEVSENLGDVEFNYEIPPDPFTQLPKVGLKLKQFDKDLAADLLIRDKTVFPAEGRPDWWYETTDGSTLILDNRIYFYDGRVDNDRSNFLTIPGRYNKFCNSSSEQLQSFSSQDAIERANKLLDELGVENYGEPCVIPIFPEMGNAMLEKYGIYTLNKERSRDDYDLWTEDDGIYILKYRLNFNGIDVCSGNLKTLQTSITVNGANITAYVNKDLIFYLNIDPWYDIVPSDEETADFKFSAGQASNALVEHYSKISSVQFPTYFTECRLEYVPVNYTNENEIVFTPAWCFMGYQNKKNEGQEDDSLYDFAEYYYVETGIRYGGY